MALSFICPCGSGKNHADCCEPLHQGQVAPSAEALMRSRYSAYVLQNIDYIIATTVPAQQNLLNRKDLAAWAAQTQWVSLTIHHAQAKIGQRHAQVKFTACFLENGIIHEHQELSGFVLMNEQWYFIDPTVPLPPSKQNCFCGSEKKFKHCCGKFV